MAVNAANLDRTAASLDLHEKDHAPRVSGDAAAAAADDYEQGSGEAVYVPPKGARILGIQFPAYRSPIVQVLIITLVHSLVVGMFNVLSALGGGGQVDPTTSNNSSTILYALFAVFSLFSGSVVNFLGARAALATGGVGYSLLAASYWCYNHTENQGFVYFGGASCGVAAAFLWCVASP